MDSRITPHTPNVAKYFSALCVRPQIRFTNQQAGELVYLLIRRHPFTQIKWIIGAVFFVVFSIFVGVFMLKFFSFYQSLFVGLFLFSIAISAAYLDAVRWIYNVGIITDERVVDVDFEIFTSNHISTTTIEDITEVTSKQSGFFAGIFGYGTIEVSTRGTTPNIEFADSPDPLYITSVLNHLMESLIVNQARNNERNP